MTGGVMSRDALSLVGVIFVIAVVSGVLTYLRAGTIASPGDLAARGLATVQRDTVGFYVLFLPVVVGIISFVVFHALYTQSPDSSQTTFLLLAVVIAIAFTVLAAVIFKMRGFIELLLLHVLYVAGFGWIMPMLLTR